MKRNKDKDYSRYHIEEKIAELSKSDNSDWGKYVLKCSMDDNPSTIDIRSMAFKEDGTHVIGKGISLTPMETDILTNTLIKKGYGETDVLEEELQNRKKKYGFDEGSEK